MTPPTHEFIQVVNICGDHWITFSNIGCTDSSSIKVYDSLGGRLSKSKKKLAADLLQSKSKTITVYYENVQKQLGGSDCGCFALAYAASLCSGIEPSTELYDQKAMRIHLLDAISNQKLTPFPTQGKRKQRKPIIDHIPIYCVCRLPDDGSEMILCSQCAESYHTSCVKVARKFIKYSGLKWTCDKCRL